MYKAVINKMSDSDGQTVTTKYDKFIEDNKDLYLREFATMMLLSLKQKDCSDLNNAAAQKDLFNIIGKPTLNFMTSFYNDESRKVIDEMILSLYLGNNMWANNFNLRTRGSANSIERDGITYNKADMAACMEVMGNPKSTEAEKKAALEKAFGKTQINGVKDLISMVDFADNVVDMVLMIQGTGLISKGLGKVVNFVNKANTVTKATTAITQASKTINLGERIKAVGISAGSFGIYGSGRYAIGRATNDIPNDFQFSE